MPDKSNPFRFTLLFNEHDRRHRQVVEILNQQGKSKSQYIVTAILHYIDCNKIPIDTSDQYRSLEGLADRIIRETAKCVIKKPEEKQSSRTPISAPRAAPLAPSTHDTSADRDLLSAGIGAFQSRK